MKKAYWKLNECFPILIIITNLIKMKKKIIKNVYDHLNVLVI